MNITHADSRNNLKSRAGFSLLEVLVALGVMALGISSVLGLFIAATASHKRSIDRVNATAIAEQAMADIESQLALGRNYSEIELDPPLAEIAKNWPGYEVLVDFKQLDGEISNNAVLLEVTVRWKNEGNNRTEVFEEIIARESRFSLNPE